MVYQFREPYRSIQQVYEIVVCYRLLTTTWCIAVSGVEVIHLVYNALWHLTVCIQFIYTAYGSCTPYKFREPHRSLQRVYEIVRFLATTWCSAVSGVGLVHLAYNALRDLPVYIQYIYTQPMVVAHRTKSGNRTDPYRGCTKLPFVSGCSTQLGV